METIPFIVGAAMAVFAVVLLRHASRDWGFFHQVQGLTLSPIRHVQPGLGLVEGVVEEGETIPTPYRRTPAVGYRWNATEQQAPRRKGSHERSLGSGERGCPFVLKDDTGRITVDLKGGEALSWPHLCVLRSASGKRTGLGNRIKTMQARDAQQYGAHGKKPFFRKLEAEDPLDIPDDLVELEPGSKEAHKALRKYYESWVEPGDRVFVLGTVSQLEGWNNNLIGQAPGAPLMLACRPGDLTAETFKKNFYVELLSGIVLALIGVGTVLYALGLSL